jgi:hypothetical protein
MKTQITTLHRGSKLAVGTSYKVRENISKMVNKENPYTMKVKVKDHIYDMTCSYSTTGKSYFYTANLSSEQVKDILPNDIKALQHPELVNVEFVMNMDMTCEYQTFRRRTVRSAWKQGQTIIVPESDVTIL